MPFYSGVPKTSYKTRSGETCFVTMFMIINTQVETLTPDKHVIAKLPLVPFLLINLTRLTAGVAMKVRFKFNVTSRFSFSPLRD